LQDALSRSVYLLIIWQEQVASSDRPAVWRCSLEDARTGERRSFATLEQMLAFLKEQTGDRGQRDTLD
jgi:hypothetical protein